MLNIFKKKKKFPTLAVILLVLGLIWLLSSLNLITFNIPWIPVILIIVAIGMIINRYNN
jgi:hypothetical protein